MDVDGERTEKTALEPEMCGTRKLTGVRNERKERERNTGSTSRPRLIKHLYETVCEGRNKKRQKRNIHYVQKRLLLGGHEAQTQGSKRAAEGVILLKKLGVSLLKNKGKHNSSPPNMCVLLTNYPEDNIILGQEETDSLSMQSRVGVLEKVGKITRAEGGIRSSLTRWSWKGNQEINEGGQGRRQGSTGTH